MAKKARTPEEEAALYAKRREQGMKALEKAHTPEAIAKGVETRKRNKEMQREAQYILNAELLDEDEILNELQAIGYDRGDNKPTMQTAILFNIAKKAREYADVEAMRFLRDTSGQKPVDGLQIGSMEDAPLAINLKTYTDEQLREMVARMSEDA